jgi:hypothetical protein
MFPTSRKKREIWATLWSVAGRDPNPWFSFLPLTLHKMRPFAFALE